MAVVILGDVETFKEHQLVRRAVEDRGEETIVVDVTEWPGEDPVELAVGSGECVFGEPIPFEDVTGVFSMVQTVFSPLDRHYEWYDEKSERAGYKQLREWKQLFWSIMATFEAHGAKTPTPPREHYWTFHRPWMLELYDDEGIPVPETTFTNDPERVESFVEEHSKAVVQPVNGGQGLELIRPSDLTPERLRKLAGAPIKLQEYAPGDDTRGFVVDGEFAGMVRYDYPEDAFSFQQPSVDYDTIESVALSPDPKVREAVVRAGELAPSDYAAVDVRLTDDGDFTVLESNTPGRFAAHDLAGTTDVADRIAEYLVGS
ncbi:hypothetical protein [Halorussus ruber]|uniref:hypothetical protein n=1 Tax=Halorussus ruber TaxID=1126238 RepID=UPI001092B081|nr:hypothetical protein [Halorussus ruber]